MNHWHKSSYSSGAQSCVEVAELPTEVLVRDTQNRTLGQLSFPAEQWTALLRDVKSGSL
ncbi:DUF397 domain-containing protein [Murinocardiopsis flavida]|uniref:DUF397 domain-containing protein n=1 Tax=Murinocardiopsis flavida TaxID=645275 RepID=UPI000D0D0722|nr:DUF397 domain-containing protein [Murinocardiopsis flavida]